MHVINKHDLNNLNKAKMAPPQLYFKLQLKTNITLQLNTK